MTWSLSSWGIPAGEPLMMMLMRYHQQNQSVTTIPKGTPQWWWLLHPPPSFLHLYSLLVWFRRISRHPEPPPIIITIGLWLIIQLSYDDSRSIIWLHGIDHWARMAFRCKFHHLHYIIDDGTILKPVKRGIFRRDRWRGQGNHYHHHGIVYR